MRDGAAGGRRARRRDPSFGLAPDSYMRMLEYDGTECQEFFADFVASQQACFSEALDNQLPRDHGDSHEATRAKSLREASESGARVQAVLVHRPCPRVPRRTDENPRRGVLHPEGFRGGRPL